jgi:hypothetical protein
MVQKHLNCLSCLLELYLLMLETKDNCKHFLIMDKVIKFSINYGF